MMFMIQVKPNPVTDEENIILNTDEELAVANNMPIKIGMLPFKLDEENKEVK
jgi:hypothetical protein